MIASLFSLVIVTCYFSFYPLFIGAFPQINWGERDVCTTLHLSDIPPDVVKIVCRFSCGKPVFVCIL